MAFVIRYKWIILLSAALLLTTILMVSQPIAEMLLSKAKYSQLLQGRFGLTRSEADLLGGIWALMTTVAWPPLIAVIVASGIGRVKARQILVAVLCLCAIYGVEPAFAIMTAKSAPCFNQVSGKAEKWYTIHDGQVLTFDGPGFDGYGVRRRAVSRSVCESLNRQQGDAPKLIAADPRTIRYFDGRTRKALVYYTRDSEGKLALFTGPGFDPESGDPLLPVTKAISLEAKAGAKAAELAARAEAEKVAQTQAASQPQSVAAQPNTGLQPASSAQAGSSEGASPPATEPQPAPYDGSPKLQYVPPRRPVYINAPDWLDRPDGDTLMSLFPETAKAAHVSGKATMDCEVYSDARLRNCAVLSEEPYGYGFGQATLRAAANFRMRPKLVDGLPIDGAHVTIPLRWVAPDEGPS